MLSKKSFRLAGLAVALTLGVSGLALQASHGVAAMTVTVGGAPMYPTKNIIENAVNSKDHTTLVAAVKAAGLGGLVHQPALIIDLLEQPLTSVQPGHR